MYKNLKRTLTSSSTVPSEFSAATGNTECSSLGYYPISEASEAITNCNVLSKSQFIISGQSKEESVLPDARLVNWDRWLNIHKQEIDNLESKLNRPPQCMLMNRTLDNLRVNQEKECITEASNFVSADRQRGHPNFWETDDNFKRDGKSLGTYRTVQEKYDRSRVRPDATPYSRSANAGFTGISDAISEEKGVSGEPCVPSPTTKWNQSTYVIDKKEELKDPLSLIRGHVPDCSDLVAVGTKPTRPVSASSTSPLHRLNNDSVSEAASTSNILSAFTKPEEVYKFRVEIGGRSIDATSKSWTVTFGNCLVNEKYKEFIKIYNEENSSLRYYWEIVVPPWAESNLPLTRVKNARQRFYFNKNNGVILPGCENVFWFHLESSMAGVFCEQWQFVVSHAPDQYRSFDVELQAVVAEQADCKKNLEKIDSYVEACSRYTMARKTTEEILKRSRPQRVQEVPYDWRFLEEQIFVHNNPDLFYDNKCVLQLKNLYEKVSVGPWDYSVDNLRKTLFQKSSREDMSMEIEDYITSIYELMKPNVPSFLSAQKHKTVYELLCCFANKMESESNILKSTHKLSFTLKHMDEYELDRLASKFALNTRKTSEYSQKLVQKKSTAKKTQFGKKSSAVTMAGLRSLLRAQPTGESERSIHGSVFEEISKKQEYLDALYVKTYQHLSQTIDHISAAIDSFDAQRKHTALKALKCREI